MNKFKIGDKVIVVGYIGKYDLGTIHTVTSIKNSWIRVDGDLWGFAYENYEVVIDNKEKLKGFIDSQEDFDTYTITQNFNGGYLIEVYPLIEKHKELTVSEISELLGYEVKVIK